MNDDFHQSEIELLEHLREQVHFLEQSAIAYDKGSAIEAKRLAVSIRNLVHDTARSKSLLNQLNKKDLLFLDTAPVLNPQNLLTYSGLIAITLTPTACQYSPTLNNNADIAGYIEFNEWWGKTIFADNDKTLLTRKNLILSVADQDGGAHIDPTLKPAYAKLSRQNMLRWSAHDSSGSKLEIGRPELAAVRQIAHEVLTSLEKVTGVKPPITQPELSASFSDFRLTAELVGPREMQTAKSKIGRNEPCPCGSGLKYKKCHLGSDDA